MTSNLTRSLLAAFAVFFYVGTASAQNAGTVTNHAFPIGKGAGVTGYGSLLLGSGQIAIGQTSADPSAITPTGDVTLTAAGVTAIGANKITNAMLRQSGALALIGRSANTTGNVADIQATAGSSCVFLESSSTLTCAAIATANIANSAVTNAKLANMAASTLKANATAGSAAPTDVTLAATLAFSGSTLSTSAGAGDVAWSAGTFSTTIQPAAVTNAKIANMAANTVKGNATGSAAAPTDVAPASARSSSLLNIDQFTGHGDSIYTILATDRTVGTNAAFTASRTWTLPAANGVNPGQEIVVADFQGTVTASNTLVISRAGSDTVNGGTSVTMTSANGAYLFKSDGSSKWTAQALGAAAAGGVSSVTCGTGLTGGTITTSGTCALSSPVSVANGGTGDTGTAWTTYTVTAVAGTGSLGTGATATGRYKIIGKTLFLQASVTTGTGATASGTTTLSLPLSLTAASVMPLSGFNGANGSNLTTVFISSSAGSVSFGAGSLSSSTSYYVGGIIEVN